MHESITLIPRPVAVCPQPGAFTSPALPAPQGDPAFQREIHAFEEQMRSYPMQPDKADPGAKYLRLDKAASLRPEAYRLDIRPQGISISAAEPAGAYYGLQTLRELLLSSRTEAGLTLACAEVEDYPRFPWRGFMLDCSRHFYQVGFIKKLLDALSLHHINRFHWHLTDDQGWRLPVEAYPLLTEIGAKRLEYRRQNQHYRGGFYTYEDIREVVAYAASRHIQVIPEVDFPGHASSILAAYPGLGCTGGPYRVEDRFGVFEDVLCAGNDGLFALAEAVFDTLAELFPAPWVHIGGDEVKVKRWNACPKCKKRLQETGLGEPQELQSWITVRLVQMLAARGKIALGWDEILEDSASYPLPQDTVVMSWRGRSGGLRASRKGHRVIMTPNTEGCYFDYRQSSDSEEIGQYPVATVAQCYQMDPVSPEMSAAEAALVLGGQGNLWSELIYGGRIAEYMIFPRICALAESLWTPREAKDFADFTRRLVVHRRRLEALGFLVYPGPLA